MQVKLLRLIQELEYRPVGSLQWRKVDLRIIAATHRDLKAEVAAGRFRKDLYYRLEVFVFHLPSLRERREDIPPLVDHFLELAQAAGLPPFRPSREVLDMLQSYDWPGNVRELKHSVDRMAALHSEGALQVCDLPSALQNHLAASAVKHLPAAMDSRPAEEFYLAPPSPVISIPQSEKQTIARALAATRGARAQAARVLGIGRTTLYRKMREYGIE
jgi:DNA-binding NtrC family response regulator